MLDDVSPTSANLGNDHVFINKEGGQYHINCSAQSHNYIFFYY